MPLELKHLPVYKLRELIKSAFDTGNPPVGDEVAEHHCERCTRFRNVFSGKSWDEVTTETIEWTYDKLPLFGDSAFIYYLPAFMLYSLDAPNTWVCEFTYYALAPDEKTTESSIPIFNQFTKRQKECCFHFLTWLAVQPNYLEEERHQVYIKNALHSFWSNSDTKCR